MPIDMADSPQSRFEALMAQHVVDRQTVTLRQGFIDMWVSNFADAQRLQRDIGK